MSMEQTKRRIAIVAGARPNFMKVAPIIRELREHEDIIEWQLVHTGQHYDHEMSEVFFEELNIPQPHFYMGAGGGSHSEQTARIMLAFESYCEETKPDLIVVVGDVNSTLACSIVAKKLNISVAHVEAGLRSRDMKMPEEINRIVTDSISDLFFVTEPSGAKNLRREGHADKQIHFVGHVMIDNLFFQLEKLDTMDLSCFGTNALRTRLGRYGIVTMHRPSNVDDRKVLAGIVSALNEISRSLPLVFPIHPRTQANIKKFGIIFESTIHCTGPLPYMEFLNLWRSASLILTDSGGLQEETTALGIPCITLRTNTERPITVTCGTNRLAGTDPEQILRSWRACIDEFQPNRKRPELWDGHAAQRIVAVLLSYVADSAFVNMA